MRIGKTMSRFTFATILLCLVRECLCAQGVPPLTEEEVIKKLQGTWEVASSEADGRSTPGILAKAWPTLTFTGKDYRWEKGAQGKIMAIDAKKVPIAIDFRHPNGDVDLAIIKFEGDTLFDCRSGAGAPRPQQFSTPRRVLDG
jgi:uncharacterized protein (TIGR03067 family)